MRWNSTWNADHIVTGVTAHSLNEKALGQYVGTVLAFNSVIALSRKWAAGGPQPHLRLLVR